MNMNTKIMTFFVGLSSLIIIFCGAARAEGTLPRKQLVLKNKLLYLKKGDIWAIGSEGVNERLTEKKDITNYCVSHDLTKIIFVRDFKRMFDLNVKLGKEKYLTDLETDMSNPSISKENDKVIYISKSLKEFNTSPYNKAYKERVRHLWLLDLKSLKKMDLTEDSPKQYSAPTWSPDGRWISFTSSAWDVYIKNMTGNKADIKKVAAGYYSEWFDTKMLAIGSPELITLYDADTMQKTSEIRVQFGFDPAKFTFVNSKNFYFEDQTENVNLDISYYDIATRLKRKIVEDARSPQFLK